MQNRACRYNTQWKRNNFTGWPFGLGFRMRSVYGINYVPTAVERPGGGGRIKHLTLRDGTIKDVFNLTNNVRSAIRPRFQFQFLIMVVGLTRKQVMNSVILYNSSSLERSIIVTVIKILKCTQLIIKKNHNWRWTIAPRLRIPTER